MGSGAGGEVNGGRVVMSAGQTTESRATTNGGTGGSFSIVSGYGRASSSGTFSIRTANSGDDGVTGSILASSGKTTVGSSGQCLSGLERA